MSGTDDLKWTKSTRCESNTCVEIAVDGDNVLVRDAGDPDGTQLTFSRQVWTEFIDAIKAERLGGAMARPSEDQQSAG